MILRKKFILHFVFKGVSVLFDIYEIFWAVQSFLRVNEFKVGFPLFCTKTCAKYRETSLFENL